jgi:hypothetical protein
MATTPLAVSATAATRAAHTAAASAQDVVKV